MPIKNIITLLFIVTFFIACTSKAPYTNRNQLILISQEQELALGEKSYKEALNKSEIIRNTKDAKKVKEIGESIAKIVNKKDYKWEFSLVKNSAKNAFCLPGGKVVVYTGILKVAKNDSQLATVISHEIAHALARHGAERVSTVMLSQGVQAIGNSVLGTQNKTYQNIFNKAYSLSSKYAVLMPYGRLQENEADEIGLHLMYYAGYDINEALKFWENMSKGEKQTIEFLSTHPSNETRIKNIRKVINTLNNK